MENEEKRLTRIEEKLDKMGEAIVSLARMEEKMITLFRRMDSYDTNQKTVEERLGKVELNQASNAWIERIVWLAVGAIFTYYIKGL